MKHVALVSIALLSGLCACQRNAAPDTAPTAATPAAPTAVEPAPATDLVARGDYLVRIAACNDCHTPGYMDKLGNVDKAEWMTGNTLGFHGPWGTTYPANLRLKLADMDEATWLTYTANLHVRPMMPDFNVRAMSEDDRRAIYRFVRSLGAAGQPAPAYLPPGQTPPPPYIQLVLPPPAPAGAAPSGTADGGKPPAKPEKSATPPEG